jgi:hypothetical protein
MEDDVGSLTCRGGNSDQKEEEWWNGRKNYKNVVKI